MFARPPGIGAATEILKVILRADSNRGGVPVGTIYPCDEIIVLSAGEPVNIFHIALAAIKNGTADPIVQVSEGQFPKKSVDRFQFSSACVGVIKDFSN